MDLTAAQLGDLRLCALLAAGLRDWTIEAEQAQLLEELAIQGPHVPQCSTCSTSLIASGSVNAHGPPKG